MESEGKKFWEIKNLLHTVTSALLRFNLIFKLLTCADDKFWLVIH